MIKLQMLLSRLLLAATVFLAMDGIAHAGKIIGNG